MRDFPSCFGENGVQVADASCSSNVGGVSKAYQNLVTCIYQCKLHGKSCIISVIWSKNLMGHCLSVEIDDLSHHCLCKVDVKPSLFSKRRGSKCLDLNSISSSGKKIDLFWDLSLAKFGSGPEPLEGYYLALMFKGEMVLLIGDLRKEAFKKTNATPARSTPLFISKREHLFGKRVYCTKAQFCDNGQIHDLRIESDSNGIDDPCLMIRIDSKTVMQVRNLQWKFRGNYTILVDGLPVEVFWDVYNWLFGNSGFGSAVFVFQSCLSAEKMWASQTLSDDDVSILPWPSSGCFGDSNKLPGLGFSLVLYVWKNE
ncbi:hypothetical protein ACH5RR_031295 [Cinchona calisaya]|uniref:DUF868 domain-containing protein n=1 Tax=Cinchona calisaya TaxID=153742 RepID=A0ABD2YFU2_9GENT